MMSGCFRLFDLFFEKTKAFCTVVEKRRYHFNMTDDPLCSLLAEDATDKFNACDPQWNGGAFGNIAAIRVAAPELFLAILLAAL